MSPDAAVLWLEAAAWLGWFKPVSDGLSEAQIHTAVIQAVQDWAAEAGRLNPFAARELPHTLHRMAALERRKRLLLSEACCRILAEGGQEDWRTRAQAAVKLYGR
ncbi:hypothetical protein [Neisseria sp. 74A18]|uniref:hypothetical protein n=1 Tax=Neisseria sp. 74A18 TaxID=1696094 RepID=UPI0006CAC2D9|nr:hypothetical protein [Neisseria sp. 74A18]KPN74125.1 hypothetical protein AKG43_04135 [Neisseria sp. 74A18]